MKYKGYNQSDKYKFVISTFLFLWKAEGVEAAEIRLGNTNKSLFFYLFFFIK